MTRFIFVSFSIFVMLFYRPNHDENIFKQLIYSLNVPVLSVYLVVFGLCVGVFKNRGKFSNRIDLSCVWGRRF